jgi:hypothetical protein
MRLFILFACAPLFACGGEFTAAPDDDGGPQQLAFVDTPPVGTGDSDAGIRTLPDGARIQSDATASSDAPISGDSPSVDSRPDSSGASDARVDSSYADVRMPTAACMPVFSAACAPPFCHGQEPGQDAAPNQYSCVFQYNPTAIPNYTSEGDCVGATKPGGIQGYSCTGPGQLCRCIDDNQCPSYWPGSTQHPGVESGCVFWAGCISNCNGGWFDTSNPNGALKKVAPDGGGPDCMGCTPLY